MTDLTIWRHPRPEGVAARCIGRTDVQVDRRRAKRLAHRIRQHARREGAPGEPPEIWTSRLQRCASVGRFLAQWGWRHRIDDRLLELDFGSWDGHTWQHIGPEPVAAWCDDFLWHAPGGGESLGALMRRCADCLTEWQARPRVFVVGHAGWINAARRLMASKEPVTALQAADWPGAPPYGAMAHWAFTGTAPISACNFLASQ